MTTETDTPREIEREIEADRTALRKTLGELQDELSFDGLSRRVAMQFREHGSDWAHSASNAARANPVALALTGVGVGWMIFGRGYDPAHRVRHHLSRRTEPASSYSGRDTALPISRSDSPAIHRKTSRFDNGSEIQHQENSMTETLKDKVWHLRNRLSEGTEDLSEEARHRVQAARRRAIHAREAAARSFNDSSRAVSRSYDSEPLPFGVAAFMIGAGLAALLPRTKRENEMLGRYSSELFDEAETIYEEEKAKIKGAVSAGLEEAKSAASDVRKAAEEGFSETSASPDKTSPASSVSDKSGHATGQQGSNR